MSPQITSLLIHENKLPAYNEMYRNVKCEDKEQIMYGVTNISRFFSYNYTGKARPL
jgi:hypothetical protein